MQERFAPLRARLRRLRGCAAYGTIRATSVSRQKIRMTAQ
jgi:hypothetical protein